MGIVGLAGVHALYFLAIDRLEIGVALTIQYAFGFATALWLIVQPLEAAPLVHSERTPSLG